VRKTVGCIQFYEAKERIYSQQRAILADITVESYLIANVQKQAAFGRE
jgi:hypothetical protein